MAVGTFAQNGRLAFAERLSAVRPYWHLQHGHTGTCSTALRLALGQYGRWYARPRLTWPHVRRVLAPSTERWLAVDARLQFAALE
eukprot:1841232-Prymnesium_polylepis.1